MNELKNLTQEQAQHILTNLVKPERNDIGGMSGGWTSANGLVGAGYAATSMNDLGYYIAIDFEQNGIEHRYVFEPDAKPHSFGTCHSEVRRHLKELID